MCRWRSGIITFNDIILSQIDGDQSHTQIRRDNNIPENSEIKIETVQIEILPCGRLDSVNPVDWECFIDQDLLPDWFKGDYAKQLKKEALEKHIKSIENLDWSKIGGSLDLQGTQITALPEGLSVGGYLYLWGTNITALPEGLSVGGSLDLQGTQITALPEGLSVGGSLYLWGTNITALPEGLSVGGYLDLQGTQITALPEGLSIGGSLYLQGTQITALPEGLSVGGYLDLRGTNITALPDKFRSKVIK